MIGGFPTGGAGTGVDLGEQGSRGPTSRRSGRSGQQRTIKEGRKASSAPKLQDALTCTIECGKKKTKNTKRDAEDLQCYAWRLCIPSADLVLPPIESYPMAGSDRGQCSQDRLSQGSERDAVASLQVAARGLLSATTARARGRRPMKRQDPALGRHVSCSLQSTKYAGGT